MKLILTILAVVISAAVACSADKPTIYNHYTGKNTDIDAMVATALSPNYNIVDVRDSEGYLPPKVTAGHLPATAQTDAGEPLGGYVLVGYIITTEGRVAEPVILKTTDKRLNSIALKAMEDWRLEPATLKGAAIATTAAQEFNFETAPKDFVTQVLEPTGGKILRPKDWFYAASQHGPVYMWTISREDTSGNRGYMTGVRIQTFMNVKKGTGKTAKEFIFDFLESKKKEATKVISMREEENQGLFTRVGIETEEGPYHILYSLFWLSSGGDVAVVSIAGTTKELWPTYAPTFEKMSAFELIDMKRFENNK